jgi:hypothetical protein
MAGEVEEDEIVLEMGEPLTDDKGQQLKATGGERKGADLFKSITVKKK